jgi:hypothetical protein
MGEHVACIANQGKAISDNSTDNLDDKNAACYCARQDEPFSFMRPVLMFMAMLIFDMIIVYAMNVFDGFSPVKLSCHRQQLLNSPLERGAGGVSRQFYTPLYPLFLEGNHKRLNFIKRKL